MDGGVRPRSLGHRSGFGFAQSYQKWFPFRSGLRTGFVRGGAAGMTSGLDLFHNFRDERKVHEGRCQ